MDGFEPACEAGGGEAGGSGFHAGTSCTTSSKRVHAAGIMGPLGRGEMQYTAIWKAAQRLTQRPVKFGTVTPELVAIAVRDGALQGASR